MKIGIEVEGRFKGLPSVFITGPVELEEMIAKQDQLVNDYPKHRHLYYRTNFLRQEDCDLLQELSDNYTITAEVEKIVAPPIQTNHIDHIILSIMMDDFWKLGANDSVKFFTPNNHVKMITVENMISTDPSAFKDDIEI